jgi:hypothetical protein
MLTREEAIADFEGRAAFDTLARKALESVLGRNPISIMFAYEYADGRVALTTVPFSPQLARGLADAVYTMMWPTEVVAEEIDEDVE